jgi:hypothetical protein
MEHPYATDNRFGDGPNWRLRTTRVALELLGFQGNLLCHGVERQIFGCQLATNSLEYLRGDAGAPSYEDLLSFDAIADRALKRWVLPRAERNAGFRFWKREDTFRAICEPTFPPAVTASAYLGAVTLEPAVGTT